MKQIEGNQNYAVLRCGGIRNYRIGDYMSANGKTWRVVEITTMGDEGEIRMRPATLFERTRLRAYDAYREVRWRVLGY